MLSSFSAKTQIAAFPGAQGFGATVTTGGRGGQVIYVTNLNCSGPGSLNNALQQQGAKYILFKVSGIIDCAAEIEWGDCTIAGQTSPGGIIVRGIVADDWYEPSGSARNIIIRHINSRPSTAEVRPGNGWILDDALRLDAAHNVVIDHCGFANATDECVQISRSSNICFQFNTLAETLGEHYTLGGMLMNYSATNHRKDSITIHHNIWNRLGGRMPEFSCEQSGEAPSDQACINFPMKLEFSNNLLWDMPIQIWYNSGFFPENSEAPETQIRANFVGNRCVGRSSYSGPMFSHSLLNLPGNQFYTKDNSMNLYPGILDYGLFYCCNDFDEAQNHPNTDMGSANLLTSRLPYPTISYSNPSNIEAVNSLLCGPFNAYSTDYRDQMTKRLMLSIIVNSIDPSPVNGMDPYQDAFDLDFSSQPAAPLDSDNDGMPNDWELANGLNPQVADHNGTQLSVAITGIAGYTNLECYLHCLSEHLIKGIPLCMVSTAVDEVSSNEGRIMVISPNPADEEIWINWKTGFSAEGQLRLIDLQGRVLKEQEVAKGNTQLSMNIAQFPAGIYLVQWTYPGGQVCDKLVIR